MLQRVLLISSLVCLSACVHNGPKLTACLVDSVRSSCDCYDERTGKSFILTLAQCDKYVAMPSPDFETLLNYCAGRKR